MEVIGQLGFDVSRARWIYLLDTIINSPLFVQNDCKDVLMVDPLLKTKLHQPTLPSRCIQRTNLISALTANLATGRVLTLVSAPAGFGKTTLVSEWVRSLPLPQAWLSLERADDDPERFFIYLIAALKEVNVNVGQEIQGALHSGQLSAFPAIAVSLVNDILAAESHFILVLDDFQVIQDQSILEALGMILANPPEQLHLVLVTREDPALPVGRLRANNQMMEIRAGDLRFSEGEVDQFLNGMMGLSLSRMDIAAMENRTEGWAAGLQLAAIAMANRSDRTDFIHRLSGSYRYILSYLTEEVLGCQADDIQNFLLQTSILEKLCGALCEAVTGLPGSHALLEKCYHQNLFLIPQDEEGRWYRYHHLFRDLLLNRQSRIPRQDILELHRRASRWYEEAGMAAEAIEHALAAEDYPQAVQLIEKQALEMIMQGFLKTVEGWMQTLPSEWQPHNPRANLAFGWMHLLRGSYHKVHPYLDKARQVVWDSDPHTRVGRSLRAEWLSLQATFLNVQGEVGLGIEPASQALEWAPQEDFYVRSLAYSALGGACRLAGSYSEAIQAFQQAIQASRAGGHAVPEMLAVGGLTALAMQHGRLHYAYEAGSQALERLEREAAFYSPMAGAVHSCLGLVCYEWNQLEKAAGYLLKGIQLSNLSGHNAGVVYARVILARVFQAQGDAPSAARAVKEATSLLPFGLPAWLKGDVASHLARYYLEQGNAAAAQALLEQMEFALPDWLALTDPAGLPDPLTHRAGLNAVLSLRFYLSQVRVGKRMEALQSAIDLAGSLVRRALPVQRVEIALQALLVRAQLETARGGLAAAQPDVRQAVELAEPEGYLRTFLDEGPAVAELLSLAARGPARLAEPQAEFIRQILESSNAVRPVPVQWQANNSPDVPVEERLAEPLTERELDVLKLIAEGLTYQEIASRLFITLNTVRFYVKEIYSKLNVDNRTQAIRAAHRHKLL